MTMTSAPDPRAVLAFARQMARKHMLLDLRSTGRKPRDVNTLEHEALRLYEKELRQ